MTIPRSTFPLRKPFEKLAPGSAPAEIAMYIVVNFFSEEPYVVGTASLVTGHFLITAKHVFDAILGYRPDPSSSVTNVDKHIVAVQLVPGEEVEYFIWDVLSATTDPETDIALLHLGSNPHRSHETPIQYKGLAVNPFPPSVGERVTAFGYRKSTVKTSKNVQGAPHIDLNGELISSIGIVKEIHEFKRDNSFLPFPCYQVSARFDAGMSGGPVFDEKGFLCGIVCSNIDGSHLDGEPVSYVTTLWPMFRLIISQNRGDKYPRDVKYPMIELAKDKLIRVADLAKLEDWFAKYIKN